MNSQEIMELDHEHAANTYARFPIALDHGCGALLYDADGKSLTLSAGRSYLALVSSLTGQELQVTDGSGTSLLPAAPSESAGS